MADTGVKLHTTDDMPFDSDSVSESAVLPQQHQQTDDDLHKSNDSGEEYSSGSDRSIEADNVDELRGDLSADRSSGDAPIVAARIRSKRHRHGSHGSRRHKGGSRHKYRSGFQPYPDTGDLETSLKRKSLELQEKENAAALLRQEGGEDHFVTFPVAPFNSTQFLMDEHSVGSTPNSAPKSDFSASHSPKMFSQDVALNSVTSTPSRIDSDDIVRLAEYNSRTIDKEFSDFYSSIHAENLQSMPKEELVKHYMSLEEQVAALQKKVAEAEQRSVGESDLAGKKLRSDSVNDKDCATGSDTNSLSSGNEDFIDLSSINAPTDEKPGIPM